MVRSRLNKLLDVLERQQDLLADKTTSFLLLRKEITHVEEQISFTMDRIVQERDKAEASRRGRLLPVPQKYGPKPLQTISPDETEYTPVETEHEAEGTPEKETPTATKIAALEQGIKIKVPCFLCGRHDVEIAQIIPMPNLADTIKQVPVCEECWQKERRKRYPNAPKTAFTYKAPKPQKSVAECSCAACLAARLRRGDGDKH
jgi:hypothetical protein